VLEDVKCKTRHLQLRQHALYNGEKKTIVSKSPCRSDLHESLRLKSRYERGQNTFLRLLPMLARPSRRGIFGWLGRHGYPLHIACHGRMHPPRAEVAHIRHAHAGPPGNWSLDRQAVVAVLGLVDDRRLRASSGPPRITSEAPAERSSGLLTSRHASRKPSSS